MIGRVLSGISTVAMRGRSISAAHKFGLASVATGFAIKSAANSDFAEQYLVGRYGREQGESKLAGRKTVGNKSIIAGMGLMAAGGYKAVTGKSITGLGAGLRQVRDYGSAGLNKMLGLPSVSKTMATVSGHMPSLPKIHKKGVKQGSFIKRHPYISTGIAGGFAGMGMGAYSASRRRYTPEGSISAVRGFTPGSGMPFAQFSPTPGMMGRISRNAPRVIQ